MFGIRFIKSQPTTHLMQFRGGQLVREGAGLSFFYYSPSSSLVAVPIASRDAGFMLELVTSDFQGVTVQGELTYRVGDPARISRMMDFSLTPDGRAYASDDPERLQERVVMQVRAIVQQVIQALPLRKAIQASAEVARAVQGQLGEQPEVQALGLEILGVAVVAIRPTPDIARALEAEAREANLKAADDAISQRRMAGVQNERAIRQTELKVRAVMDALENADPRVVQALAAVGMQPGQLIAQAFGGLAERAERIGQLNLSPDLLGSLLAGGTAAPTAAAARRPS